MIFAIHACSPLLMLCSGVAVLKQRLLCGGFLVATRETTAADMALPPAHHRLRHTASADGDCYNDQDDIKKSIFMLRVLLL